MGSLVPLGYRHDLGDGRELRLVAYDIDSSIGVTCLARSGNGKYESVGTVYLSDISNGGGSSDVVFRLPYTGDAFAEIEGMVSTSSLLPCPVLGDIEVKVSEWVGSAVVFEESPFELYDGSGLSISKDFLVSRVSHVMRLSLILSVGYVTMLFVMLVTLASLGLPYSLGVRYSLFTLSVIVSLVGISWVSHSSFVGKGDYGLSFPFRGILGFLFSLFSVGLFLLGMFSGGFVFSVGLVAVCSLFCVSLLSFLFLDYVITWYKHTVLGKFPSRVDFLATKLGVYRVLN